MKYSLVLLVSLFASSAFACVEYGTQKLCPGSDVIPSGYSTGYATVVDVNGYTNQITVKSTNNNRMYQHEASELSIMKGCLGKVCVGQTVTPPGYSTGSARVVAVNPIKNIVVVRSSNNNRMYEHRPEELSTQDGCLARMCVGDSVNPMGYSTGYAVVVAVNKDLGQIQVRSTNNNRIYTHTPEELAVRKGCLEGICVKDTVIPNGYSTGNATVIAINFRSGTFIVRSSNNNRLYPHEARDLAVSDLCADYSEVERYAKRK